MIRRKLKTKLAKRNRIGRMIDDLQPPITDKMDDMLAYDLIYQSNLKNQETVKVSIQLTQVLES